MPPMHLEIDIEKTLRQGRQRFTLQAKFRSDEDFVVLFGPSGAGKTLTLQSIAGLLVPDRGRIVANRRILFDSGRGINLPVRNRGIGYVFQDYALFPHLSVAENIGFALKAWWYPSMPRAARQRVQEMLEIFEIAELAERRPRELSGGQRQRVALARALAHKPDLLLLDEPFAALNPLLRARLRLELLDLHNRFNIPVVLITHDQQDVEAFAKTLVVYDNGRVKQVFPFKKFRAEQPSFGPNPAGLCGELGY